MNSAWYNIFSPWIMGFSLIRFYSVSLLINFLKIDDNFFELKGPNFRTMQGFRTSVSYLNFQARRSKSNAMITSHHSSFHIIILYQASLGAKTSRVCVWKKVNLKGPIIFFMEGKSPVKHKWRFYCHQVGTFPWRNCSVLLTLELLYFQISLLS